MGDGHYRKMVSDAAEKYSNIHYQQAVPSDQLHSYTASADIGLCGVENVCLSYYLSLPNKIFEYFSAGIPSVVPEFPEMGRFIKETKAGWVHGDSTEDLLNCIKTITPESVARCRDRITDAITTNNWAQEQDSLLDSYRRIML